jgi:hypothetical protein
MITRPAIDSGHDMRLRVAVEGVETIAPAA